MRLTLGERNINSAHKRTGHERFAEKKKRFLVGRLGWLPDREIQHDTTLSLPFDFRAAVSYHNCWLLEA